MGLTTTYSFSDPQNYSYDPDKIEFGTDASGNTVARLRRNPLLDEAVGYWKGDGDASDSGTNGLDGTWVGTEAYTTLGSFNAFLLDGTASYVSVGPNDLLEVGSDDFSVCCTFSISDFSSNRFLFDKGTGGYVDGYGAYIDTAGKIVFVTDGDGTTGAKYYLYSTTTISLNTQYTVVFVRRNGVKEIWINGVRESNTQPDNRELSDNTRPFLIGKSDYDAGGFFSGAIGHVAIFNRALTEDEITNFATDKWIKTYPTDNPTIRIKQGVLTTGIISGSETANIPTGTVIKRIAIVNGTYKWYNPTTNAWEDSDGTYDQANTAEEMGPHLQELDLSDGAQFLVLLFLHSDDGTETPEIDEISIEYNYYQPPSSVSLATVYGYVKDIFNNGIENVSVTVELSSNHIHSKETSTIFIRSRTTYTNIQGYWSVTVPKPENFKGDVDYIFRFSIQERTKTYTVKLTNDDIIPFGDLL